MPQLWFSVMELVSFIALPVLLFVQLYILYSEFPGFMQRVGLGRKEVGLLIIGSLIGWVSDIPVLIYGNSLLAINISGGIIPLVLSVYLVREKRLSPWLVGVGIAIVAVITYKVTYIMPDVGIVSEFPYYLIPAALSAAIALLCHRSDIAKSGAFAYVLATMGTIVADIVRIPELFRMGNFMGSIGGAGALDMVFTSGLLAMGICFLFAMGRLSKFRRARTGFQVMEKGIRESAERAERALAGGNATTAAQLAYTALAKKTRFLGKRFGIEGEEEAIIERLGLEFPKLRDFSLLKERMRTGRPDEISARKAYVASILLLEELKHAERKMYASGFRRAGAFLIDFVVVSLLILAGFMFLLAGLNVNSLSGLVDTLSAGSVWFMAFILWAWALQMLYFTVLEFFTKGQSIGKKVMSIRVVTVEQRRASFMHVFTRNVVRFLDIILIFYLVSFLAIEMTEKRQRLGDYVADTVVIRERKG